MLGQFLQGAENTDFDEFGVLIDVDIYLVLIQETVASVSGYRGGNTIVWETCALIGGG